MRTYQSDGSFRTWLERANGVPAAELAADGEILIEGRNKSAQVSPLESDKDWSFRKPMTYAEAVKEQRRPRSSQVFKMIW